LKYLPNMLACHVTIIHDNQGPSNTITCGEASAMLSIGESLRVIQRGKADLCFCGGAESKMNPMVYYRQELTGRLTTTGNDDPAQAVRPYDLSAAGMVAGDGGGIVMLEALETYQQRGGENAYAQIVGFGASQSVNRQARNSAPDPQGKAVVSSVTAALKEAGIAADKIDLIVGFGCGVSGWDSAEVNGLKALFGERLEDLPVVSLRSMVGNCGAGGGGLDVAVAAKALREQKVPAVVNRDTPIQGLAGSAPSKDAELQHVLVFNMGFGGQHTAMVLKAME
jgi:3-oxoacyl-[acyl-carrier-protein] synthase II